QFITYNASYDRNIIDSTYGVGLLANRDVAGQATLTTDNVSLIFSKQFRIHSFTLSVGIQGTYHEKSVDWSKLTMGDEIDATRGFIYPTSETADRNSIGVADFSAGLLGYGKNYFVGFAMDHIAQPDESFVTGNSPLPIKYIINAGAVIPIGSFTLSPTILYQKQEDFYQELVELYLSKWHFTAAIGYRINDALIFTLGYQNTWLRIGYSYDYTTSMLTNAAGGCHEVSLAILLPYKSAKLKKVSGINLPLF
ncbi:MAG TPA: PorP/SprF family type IX secretion system membrane protein, partial [Bacteroidia bacterium]|nr:PorP/SprF family type IX secretion system membrane protein [Bacteroidia bacterium]